MSQSGYLEFIDAFDLNKNIKEDGTHNLIVCKICDGGSIYAIEDYDPICPNCDERRDIFEEETIFRCTRPKCTDEGTLVDYETCQGTFNGKPCERKTEAVGEDEAWGIATVAVAAKNPIAGLRAFHAAIKAAEGWKGTAHHKNKGGQHTASASATHARGDQETAQHRRSYIENIRNTYDEVIGPYEDEDKKEWPGELKLAIRDAIRVLKLPTLKGVEAESAIAKLDG